MLQPGDRIGPYRIEETIGTGGFATVFAAADDRLRNQVAIKVLADNHAASPDLRRRFFDEGHLLRKAASDALVAIHDVGEQDGQPYLVLDYCDRGDLTSRVEDRPGEPSVDDVRLLLQLLGSALGDLEALGIAHRDIKPSNVLLASRPTERVEGSGLALRVFDADDRLLLSDLGLAKNLAAGSGITLGAGTGSFAAPEQREWLGTISSSTDIYGASALIHWFVTGRPPRHDQPGVMTRGDGAMAAGYEGAIQAALEPALVRGMSADPADRHAGAREWSADLLDRLDRLHRLDDASSGLDRPAVAPPAESEPSGRWSSSTIFAGLAALSVLAVAVATLWPFDTQDANQPESAPPTSSVDEPVDAADDSARSSATNSREGPEPGSDLMAAAADLDLRAGPIAVSEAGAAASLVTEVLAGFDRIDGAITFAPGSTEPDSSVEAVVEEVSSALASGPLVELRGFDDGDANPVLGEERARAVQRLLVENHGLPTDLLLVVGAEATAEGLQGAVEVIVRDRDDGGLLSSRWNDIPELWDQPDSQMIVPGLRSFASRCPTVCAVQIEGLLTAQETGEHNIALLGDQQAELWLSDSADPARLQPFIGTLASGSPAASGSITLAAGQSVYVRLRTVHVDPDPSTQSTGVGNAATNGVVATWQTPFGDGWQWVSSTVLAPPERP